MISISINNQWSVSASTISISISMSISNRWSASAPMISISINNDCTPHRQSLRHGYLAEFACEWLKLKMNARRSWRSWSYCNATTANRTASSSKNTAPSATLDDCTPRRQSLRHRYLAEFACEWLKLKINARQSWWSWSYCNVTTASRTASSSKNASPWQPWGSIHKFVMPPDYYYFHDYYYK